MLILGAIERDALGGRPNVSIISKVLYNLCVLYLLHEISIRFLSLLMVIHASSLPLRGSRNVEVHVRCTYFGTSQEFDLVTSLRIARGNDSIGSLAVVYGIITDIFGWQIIEAPSSSHSIRARYLVTLEDQASAIERACPPPKQSTVKSGYSEI
jgi:hypothetical protein